MEIKIRIQSVTFDEGHFQIVGGFVDSQGNYISADQFCTDRNWESLSCTFTLLKDYSLSDLLIFCIKEEKHKQLMLHIERLKDIAHQLQIQANGNRAVLQHLNNKIVETLGKYYYKEKK